MRRVKMADETAARWSLLGKDLLLLIGKRLNTRLDTLRLRSVCSSWRSSIPPFKKTPPLPLTLPFPICPNPALHLDRRGHFCLSESPIFFFLPPDDQTVPNASTSKGSKIWLLRVEERGNGKFHPLNPLSKIMTEKVVRNFPRVLNLMNVRVFEIGKGFSLEFVETSKNIDRTFGELKSILIKKVVVSSRPCTPNGDDFALVAIHGAKLGFIKLGDENWSLVDDPNKYEDVAYYNGKFYAVDFRRRTVVFGSGSGSGLEVKEVVPALPYYCGGQFKYLVVSNEGLFMIDKYMDAEDELRYDDYGDDGDDIDNDVEVHLRVYKLNEERNDWESVDSLGDEVFFVGDDCTYCVSVQDFPGLKRNCIYFLDDQFGDNEGLGDLCVDFGVYRMEDGKCGALESFKGHSKFFWPPPPWLKANLLPLKK